MNDARNARLTDTAPGAVAADRAAGLFALPARVAHDVAPALLAQSTRALADGVPGIDLSACQDFDSSLIALLLELLRQASARGAPIRFAMPPANLRKLAALYGVDALLFPVTESA
jgi:phospholipid transport system transporter-binding protein